MKKLTPNCVNSEILRLKKNQYSHIDRCIFIAIKPQMHADDADLICVIRVHLLLNLEGEEVLDDLTSLGVLLVKKLRMELHTVEPAPLLLHRLDLACFV